MREVRRAIAADPADRLARSDRIWARIVAATALGPPRNVLLFESLPTEPETAGLVRVVPRARRRHVRAGGRRPGAARRAGTTRSSCRGPARSRSTRRLLDVVVVPGLAFTADGRRLGQGGGHYDRFLPRLRAGCVTIGAAFAEQLVDDLPTEPHDVRLDLVVTDA